MHLEQRLQNQKTKKNSSLNLLNSSNRKSWGIALTIIGVPLGMYFNYLLPVIKWSPVFMLLSVILIIDYRNLRKMRFPLFNKIFLTLFGFQLLMLTYGLLSDNMSGQYITFHLYVIALVIALTTQKNTFFESDIVKFTFILSSVCTILGAFFLYKGLITGQEAWELRQGNADYALEAFTASGGAIVNLASGICLLNSQQKKYRILTLLFIVGDLYIALFIGKRTPVLVSLAMILVFFYKKGSIDGKVFLKYFKIFIACIIISIILYFSLAPFQETVDKISYDLYAGVLNMFGETSVRDSSGSAIARFEARNWAYDYIAENFRLYNYIIGKGYMTRWLDNPLLQSYLDMGIIGLFFNLFLIVIFPIKFVIKKNKNESALMLFAILFNLYFMMSILNSGNPYTYGRYIPVVLLAFAANLNKTKKLI